MADRKPFLVDDAGDCMDCSGRPARIAHPGPGGSTWLLCSGCSMHRVTDDMEQLTAELQALSDPTGNVTNPTDQPDNIGPDQT